MKRAAQLLLVVIALDLLKSTAGLRPHTRRARQLEAGSTKLPENQVGKRQYLQHSAVVGERAGLPEVEDEREQNRIPHILHYIFLSGFKTFVDTSNNKTTRMEKKFYDSCIEVYPHWEVKFWTMELAENLVKDHYPWFLPVWNSYDLEIKRSDAIRPFILHHYGGMYLDLDNECYEPAEKLFKQYDAVLQGSGWEGLNNGMMASAPGHPLWMTLVEILTERHTGSTTEPLKNHPLFMTGPSALFAAAERYFKEPVSGFINREIEQQYLNDIPVPRRYAYMQMDGRKTKVYVLGEFFMPCWGTDQVCFRQLENGLAHGTWDMTGLVGRHWFAGSWNRPDLLIRAQSSTTPENT